jgi:hypothetical protein
MAGTAVARQAQAGVEALVGDYPLSAETQAVGSAEYRGGMTVTQASVDRLKEDIQVIGDSLLDLRDDVRSHGVLLTQITARLDGHDARLDRIDARLDGHDARFDSIDAQLTEILARLPQRPA